jgi:hypothetical protein
MSVRTDRNTPSEASTVDTAVISDVASFALNGGAMDHVNATISAAQNADAALGEANTISTNSPHCPLKRTVAVNIRASLGDLCLRKQKCKPRTPKLLNFGRAYFWPLADCVFVLVHSCLQPRGLPRPRRSAPSCSTRPPTLLTQHIS